MNDLTSVIRSRRGPCVNAECRDISEVASELERMITIWQEAIYKADVFRSRFSDKVPEPAQWLFIEIACDGWRSLAESLYCSRASINTADHLIAWCDVQMQACEMIPQLAWGYFNLRGEKLLWKTRFRFYEYPVLGEGSDEFWQDIANVEHIPPYYIHPVLGEGEGSDEHWRAYAEHHTQTQLDPLSVTHEAMGPRIVAACWRHMRNVLSTWPPEPDPDSVCDPAAIRRAIDIAREACSEESNRGQNTNVRADTKKIFWHEDPDVRDLEALIRKEDGDKSQNAIALEFTRGDERRSQSLLKTIRRVKNK